MTTTTPECAAGCRFDCPHCSPDSRRFRLGVKGRGASCFSCGKVGLAWSLAKASGRPYQEIKQLLGDAGPDREPDRPRGRLLVPAGVGPLLGPHQTYLRKRGFDPERIVKLWSVGGIGLTRRLPWRLFIPVESGGQAVSWTTRALADDAFARYVGAKPEEERVSAKAVLYGLDYVGHAAVVCEGPISAWAVGPGAVATLGLGWTAAQLALLATVPLRVVCFDAEPAARRRAGELCRALAAFPGRTIDVELETGGDPAEADPREVAAIRREFLRDE